MSMNITLTITSLVTAQMGKVPLHRTLFLIYKSSLIVHTQQSYRSNTYISETSKSFDNVFIHAHAN